MEAVAGIPLSEMSESAQLSFKHLHPKLIEQLPDPPVEEDKNVEYKFKIHNCYKLINSVLSNYVDMNPDYRKIVAIWIIGTYFHEDFNTYPYLFFNAMRGSGKTRLLKLVSSMAAKGDGSVQNNLTEAVLFRIPRGTTTCIDEVEQIGSKEKQTLREILNSAYKKGMKVKRMKKVKTMAGEEQKVETFEPYFPIAMANIWGMDEVLGDRSITLILEKSDDPRVTKKIEDFETNPIIQEIRATLNELSVVMKCSYVKKTYKEHWNNYIDDKYYIDTTTLTTLTTLNYTTTSEEIERLSLFNKLDESGINGRNFELLFPLVITAKMIDDELFEEILKIGIKITEEKRDDEYSNSKDVNLYCFVDSMNSFGLNLISVKELTARFRQFCGDSDDQDRWLNDKWLGRALKRLNLTTFKKRMNDGIYVILNFAKAHEKIKIFKTPEEK
jgi:hypothetical protein